MKSKKENKKIVMLNSFQNPLHLLRANKVEILRSRMKALRDAANGNAAVQDDNIANEALNKGYFRDPFRSAFTLIELLVVVLIIGILAAVAVPQYQKAVQKTRAVEAITTMDSFKKAMQLYILRNGIPANEDARIAFTGEVKSDVLDMNISCLREQEDSCFTKYWEYTSICDAESCWARSIAREPLPTIELLLEINASGSVSYQCTYFSTEGEAFCKTLPSPWSDNIVEVN